MRWERGTPVWMGLKTEAAVARSLRYRRGRRAECLPWLFIAAQQASGGQGATMSTSATGVRRQVILRQIQRCSQEYGPRSPATRLWQDELRRFDNAQEKPVTLATVRQAPEGRGVIKSR